MPTTRNYGARQGSYSQCSKVRDASRRQLDLQMPQLPPAALSEEETPLLQQVREQLLGKAPAGTLFLPYGAPTSPRVARWLRAAAMSAGLVAAVLGVLEWLDPETFAGCRNAGTLVLLGIGLGWLMHRGRQQKIAKKQGLRPVPPPPMTFWPRLLLSLYWFVIVELVVLTPGDMVWIVATLALHESGHYLGMRIFGYRDVHMFFVPALGAAVSGQKPGVPGWQEGIVLLLGPLPGLVLGCSIYLLDLVVPLPLLHRGATWLVALNFLNLLPFEPLDGGKLCNRHLFSRFRWLEVVTVVLGTVGLVLVCWGPAWICLALSGVFALFVLAPARYKMAGAAADLQARWPQLPAQWHDLSEEQWHDLFRAARGSRNSKKPFLQLDPLAAQMVVDGVVAQMRALHARALLRPESARATLAILAVYLSALALGIGTASFTRLRDDAARWPFLVPGSGQEARG
jgi:Zn-dependent protease